jgi:hypothetical protein
MTNEQIEKFLDPKHLATTVVKIDFKTRNSIMGIFLKTNDYTDLKQKNFWRVVSGANLEPWKKSHDNSLARIFNGQEFTKLSIPKSST